MFSPQNLRVRDVLHAVIAKLRSPKVSTLSHPRKPKDKDKTDNFANRRNFFLFTENFSIELIELPFVQRLAWDCRPEYKPYGSHVFMLEGCFWGLRGKFIIITSFGSNAGFLVPSREFILLGCVLKKSQNYFKLFQFRVLSEILLEMHSTY